MVLNNHVPTIYYVILNFFTWLFLSYDTLWFVLKRSLQFVNSIRPAIMILLNELWVRYEILLKVTLYVLIYFNYICMWYFEFWWRACDSANAIVVSTNRPRKRRCGRLAKISYSFRRSKENLNWEQVHAPMYFETTCVTSQVILEANAKVRLILYSK